MTPAEDLEIRSVQKTHAHICLVNNFPAICRGASYWEADVKGLLLLSSYTLFGVACRYNFKKNIFKYVFLIDSKKTPKSRMSRNLKPQRLDVLNLFLDP